MYKRGIIHLIVVALGTCVAPAGQPGQDPVRPVVVSGVEKSGGPDLPSAADPNQTWDPAAHLVGGWTSITRTIHQDRYQLAYRYLSVDFSFTIVDPNRLLGLDAGPIDGVLTLDENAKAFYSSTSASGRSYRPLMYGRTRTADGSWVPELQPYSFSVTMPVDAKRACPVVLSRLEVPTHALIAGAVQNVDLPFQVSTQWADVAPGLQVLVHEARVIGTRYVYTIRIKYNPSQVDVSLWSNLLFRSAPREVIITKMDILDAQGQSIPDQSNGIFLNEINPPSSRNLGDMMATGSGDCPLCAGAATIRFVLALDPYEKEIRFVLQSIPVPILW